jgi:hypothetical protein
VRWHVYGKPQDGRTNEPPDRRKLLELVQSHIDRIDHELDVQFKRIAEIQREVDLLRANLKRLATASRLA